MSPRVRLIACGVLRPDVARVGARSPGGSLAVEFLPGGLHEKPRELRQRLQQAIDAVDPAQGYERIVLGYGLCGRGTVGLTARSLPLVVPKVHDCISLFLGSDAAYRREFKRYPGTYYVCAGWYEEKVRPSEGGEAGPTLEEKYGPEEAQAITEFLTSWQRNYQRAAFIDTGAQRKRVYAEHARTMARDYGWKYEEIPGDLRLLEACLTALYSTDEVAFIAPGHTTIYDAGEGGLRGAPPGSPPEARPSPRAPSLAAGAPPGGARETPRLAHLGLGIDAGGTYTDVVVYDRERDVVMAKGKAPTTKWDFTEGIGNALDGLGPLPVRQVELVAISTTLATNAIVEGQGQQVGLLVMPPYGIYSQGDIPHEPTAVIRGRLDISGSVLEAVDTDQVVETARLLRERHGVQSFAVSGFAGAVNPEHELAVKRALQGAHGLGVTCGHELSDLLDFRTRAVTAVLNARIIPRLERFLRDARRALEARGIHGTLMVVKGDGTLMSAQSALDRPVETILSGPAASVAGARYLTGCRDGIVVDVGGTTTDTALLRAGEVALDERGTRVGGYDTHVRALRMRTTGLGGDSLVAFHERALTLGPRRVAPLCRLGSEDPGLGLTLDYMEPHLDDFATSTHGMEVLARTGRGVPADAGPAERAILACLTERPWGATELARHLGMTEWMFLDTRRLEEEHAIQRCGLTPTDILHATGRFSRWDVPTSQRVCALYASLVGMPVDAFAERVMTLAVSRLAEEILLKQMDEEMGGVPVEPGTDGGFRHLLAKITSGDDRVFGLRVVMRNPIVGIGAPVAYLLPQAARILGAESIIPHDADVASAIGAVTSSVLVSRSARIRPDDEGRYVVEGIQRPQSYKTLEEAHRNAEAELEAAARDAALRGGAGEPTVATSFHDRTALTADGTELFLERRIVVRLRGKPAVHTGVPAE